jgi:Tol biopolymer transport system component
MRLSPGDKLGHYEVLALLGKGGMGEVYRARDTQLKRDVALKVLPADVSSDRARLARFQQEAELLASLDHPNIGHIYGIVQAEHDWALVLALIEGPTLADHIANGPLPPDEAIAYSKQIVDAMEYAHDHGVIHRDLKPANIKITPDGIVKVLDFGLAKALDQSVETTFDPENSLTLPMRETQTGVVMGTTAYMSPEQAVGKPADRRTDIFSFGVVLFEMLTGERAFHGKSTDDTLAAMVKDAPDWTALPAGTPTHVRKLLERTLQIDRKQRLQAIGEARIALENPLALDLWSSSGLTAGQIAPARSGRLPWAVAGALGFALIVAAVMLYSVTRPAPPRALIRLNVEIAPDTPLARVEPILGVGENMFALSPDGARLALTLRGADGKVRLYSRLLNQSQVTRLAGTENAYSPFFSPAGDWIGFFADGKLKKIAVEGGAAVALCDAGAGFGGSWGDDGNIIAALGPTEVLSRIPSASGTPVPVTKLNSGEVTHRWPQVLPGSQAVLFTSGTQTGAGYDNANIDVISLKTGERKTIERGGFSARYLADATGSNGAGHLFYLYQATLFAVPFDPGRLASTGSPAPVLEDVSSTGAAGGDFALAQNGTLVYLSGKASRAEWPISWVDSSGKTELLYAPPGQYSNLRFSPDGKRLAFSIRSDKGTDIWVKDLDREIPSRLSFLPNGNLFPVWTPDGKYIVFRSNDRAAPGLYAIRTDGSGEAKRLTEGKPAEFPYSFSPDGKRLAIFRDGNADSVDIFTMPVEIDPGPGANGVRLGKAELFLGTPFTEIFPVFSPDGRWLAYVSDESGNSEVYVRPFPGPGGRWQVSTGGGRFPLWSRDGRELLFETLDLRVMAVSYTAKGHSFAAGKPRVWTETRLRNAAFSNYDVAPDGKRLAALVADNPSVEKPLTHLTFVLNFFDELRRKAPAGK